MHWTDADEKLLAESAVPLVRDSGLFDDVVIAAADVPENRVLERWAEGWGVPLRYGPERDVAARILACARAFGADVVARALVWWFFLDLDLVARMLAELEGTGAEYVRVPTGCDLRFGMDVFRPRLLERIGHAFDDEGLRRTFELNPFGYVEAFAGDFDVRTHPTPPVYDRERFDAVRARMRRLWPSRWDGAGTPLFPYRLAAARMGPGAAALDVACGLGAGTALLAERGRAVGVDRSREAIERCRARSSAASFVQGDALELELPARSFDVVTSVHTMEHVPDDRAFLARIARWLRPGGALVLEVPLLARFPFAGISEPLSPDHVREYEAEALLELVGERFDVREAYGVSRGAYVDLADARGAALVVALPREAA